MWSEVYRLISEKQHILITTHTNPDLDALGSELALDEYLRSLGKEVGILNSDSVPRPLRFVDPDRRLRTFSPRRHQPIIEGAEIIFVLDASGGWERVGRIGQALAARARHPLDRARHPLDGAKQPIGGATVICIDHHPDPVDFAHLAVVSPDAAATGELIFDLITKSEGALTPSISRWLYLAILTDTGSFRFPNTSPQTHRIAACLIEAGADPMGLYRQVYEQHPLGTVRLKGHVLNSIQVGGGGQLAWYALGQDTLKAYGVKAADLDGFPGLGMQIGGVRVSLLCVEMPKGRVKVSLRSDGSLAVNQLAAQLDGGGHPSAAGAIVDGDLARVTAQMVAKIEALLESTS
jgi:phosphoesterase RecJ-like protein